MAAKTKRKTKPGHHYAADAGLVPISLLVTPEERELIRVAAARAGDRGMGAFSRRAAVEAARKLAEKI